MTPGTFRLRVRYEKGDRLAFLGQRLDARAQG